MIKKSLIISSLIVVILVSLYILDDYNKDKEYQRLSSVNSIQLSDISPRLRADKVFMKRLIIRKPEAFSSLDEKLKQDRRYIMGILQKSSSAFYYAPDKFKSDKAMVLMARSLDQASEVLKKDKELVIQILDSSGYQLQHAHESLKHDRDVVLKAVSRTLMALKYAAPELRRDKEIVLKAIMGEANAFQYADKSLKLDKTFNLKVHALYPAFTTDFAFSGKNNELGKDKEFMLEMMEINPYVFTALDDSLAKDPDIVAILKRKFGIEHRYYKRMNDIYKFNK